MHVTRVSSEEALAICHAIRDVVFVDGQGVPRDREYDGLDGEAHHYLVSDNGAPVGTARVRILDDIAKIERVAVLPDHRGSGIATHLMKYILAELRTRPDVQRACLGSQTYIVALYEKLGFKKTGPVYEDAGLPHVDMVLEL